MFLGFDQQIEPLSNGEEFGEEENYPFGNSNGRKLNLTL